MMLSNDSQAELGVVKILTTHERGHTPDELADMALRRILFIGELAPPAIRDQAVAYRDQISTALRYYLAQAQKSRDTTICNMLEQAGESRAAELVRRS